METQSVYAQYVQPFEDFPKKGVRFWDFTPLLLHPELLRAAVQEMARAFGGAGITKIAAVEAKGFLLAAPLALELNLPLLLIRKPGLIPAAVRSKKFIKEYGSGEYQIKSGIVSKGDRVLVVYDILAAAGASLAAGDLIEGEGAEVAGYCYVIELEYLHGRKDLGEKPVFSLVKIPLSREGTAGWPGSRFPGRRV